MDKRTKYLKIKPCCLQQTTITKQQYRNNNNEITIAKITIFYIIFLKLNIFIFIILNIFIQDTSSISIALRFGPVKIKVPSKVHINKLDKLDKNIHLNTIK